jgi:hypothetical protein
MADEAWLRNSAQRIRMQWPEFAGSRQRHLGAHGVGQTPAEKVAENILCDLFTTVLDWTTEQVRLQENRVDILLARLGVKYLIVEAKRPGSLDGPGAIASALEQARGYAKACCVNRIAVSDGCVFEAHDITAAGLRARLRTHLASTEPPDGLWWLSTHGIYRTAEQGQAPPVLPCNDDLLQSKYRLPARCFAYVGDAGQPTTWKLPYLRVDGSIDERRLPKAIQAVLRDYRGQQTRLPEEQVPEVLVRLATAAGQLGRMPNQDPTPAEVYVALRDALKQFGLAE